MQLSSQDGASVPACLSPLRCLSGSQRTLELGGNGSRGSSAWLWMWAGRAGLGRLHSACWATRGMLRVMVWALETHLTGFSILHENTMGGKGGHLVEFFSSFINHALCHGHCKPRPQTLWGALLCPPQQGLSLSPETPWGVGNTPPTLSNNRGGYGALSEDWNTPTKQARGSPPAAREHLSPCDKGQNWTD